MMTKKQTKKFTSKSLAWILFILALIFLCWGLYQVGYTNGVNEGKKLAYDEIILNIKQWDTGFYKDGVYLNPSSEGLDLRIESSNNEFIRLTDNSWTASWFRIINNTYLNSEELEG